MGPYILANLATAIRPFAHQAMGPGFRSALAPALHRAASHELGEDNGFMPLARRQQEGQELAFSLSTEVDFRAEAPSAAPERVTTLTVPGREGSHDDLVLAMALTCWYEEQGGRR
jgi:hypothetical protein